MFSCPHTGVALAVLFKLLERGVIRKNERVVVVSTANGLKFAEFKIKYHESKLADVKPRHINPPINVPADFGERCCFEGLRGVKRISDFELRNGQIGERRTAIAFVCFLHFVRPPDRCLRFVRVHGRARDFRSVQPPADHQSN